MVTAFVIVRNACALVQLHPAPALGAATHGHTTCLMHETLCTALCLLEDNISLPLAAPALHVSVRLRAGGAHKPR